MGLNAYIVRHGTGDFSGKGLSSTHDEVCIVNVDGPFEPDLRHPAVMLIEGALFSVIAVPAATHGAESDYSYIPSKFTGLVGPMFGGTYIATSDSRFGHAIEALLGHRFYGAIPFHDRYETVRQHEALSR